MKNRLVHLVTEFIMVFFGVLLAFLTSNWTERERDTKYLKTLVNNLIQDVQDDSVRVLLAINAIQTQRDSLEVLIGHLRIMNFADANPHIYWTYFSYNAFDPTTETVEAIIFGGDMKLVKDLNTVRLMKNLEHIDKKLNMVHENYSSSMQSFRDNFVCNYDMDNFDFKSIPKNNRVEFWNRLNFLKANVKAYYDVLIAAQTTYTSFLDEMRNRNADA